MNRRPGARSPLLVPYLAVVRKETLQTLRDRRMMFMLVGAALIQTILFGFAVDFDVDRVPTVVADLDGSATSREELRRLLADGTLRFAGRARSAADADRLIDLDRAAAALVVPPRFGADVAAGRPTRVQVIVDGTDPSRANAVASAVSRFFAGEARTLARAHQDPAGRGGDAEVRLTPRVLYNPSLGTAIYVVPGILAILLVIATTIVAAMGLSREREAGTLEQVLVTPIRSSVLLAGKMTPFVVIGLFDVLLVVTAMAWIFAVPVRGPLVVLTLGSVLYLCSTLGVGLFISTVSASQQQSFLGGFLFVLPAVLLSGIMTPIFSMPDWLRPVTWVNPLRFYAEIVRGVLLRGAGFADLALQLAVLGVYGVAILALATVRFRRRLG